MFDTALLYILLFAAIALGWTLGFRYATQGRKRQYPDWIPSVDYLLAESNDASLEKLIKIDQLDDDSTDLLLKLGKSLRDKGDISRAMQLHQRLFARPDLERSTVHCIQYELACDYAAAGLFDRAERILRELLDQGGHNQEEAASLLVELLEEEGDWADVLALYQEKKLPGATLARRVAHASCELAQRALKKDDYLEVHRLCRQATKVDPKCARAHVVLGSLAYSQGEYNEAIRCYLKAGEIDDQSIIRTLPELASSFAKIDDSRGLKEHLKNLWDTTHYVPVLLECIRVIATEGDADEAVTQLLVELNNAPSNQGFLALAELVVGHRLQLDKSQLLQLYDILRGIVAGEPKFVCGNCGFKAKEPHWRCPSCKDWATVKAYVPQPAQNKPEL